MGLTLFRLYVYGRHVTFYTDHKPLKGIISTKDPTLRIVRFHFKLNRIIYSEHYEIVDRKLFGVVTFQQIKLMKANNQKNYDITFNTSKTKM